MQKALFLSLALVLIFTGCGKKAAVSDTPSANKDYPRIVPGEKFVQNPSVEKFKSIVTCEGREDMQDCYANHAVSDNDPTLCAKMESGMDTLCLQYFYMQRNDPKSCNVLPNKAIKATCNDYYKTGKK